MAVTDEIAAKLVAGGVGVLGSSIFIGSRTALPSGAGPYLTLIETGGYLPIRTHNSTSNPAYQRPSFQIMCRASGYKAARLMCQNAYDALAGVRNVTLNGTWYLEISPMQEPIDMGLDENGRARVAFNIEVVKRPS
jgi:Bacteriophage minor capsid protein